MMTPEQFVRRYTGQAIAYDGPKYGVQCVGGFKVWCAAEGVPVVACPNDWAESYWTCLNGNGQIDASVASWQKKYFTKITDWRDFRNGDWVIWPIGCSSHPASHIAMFFDGKQFGQRQYEDNRAFCLKNTDFTDAFGALRWKGYEDYIPVLPGKNVLTINEHKYTYWRMTGNDEINVLSPGLNKVARIQEFDADVLINGLVTGANFYQMDAGNPDGQPYGMTFGDISSPLNGVYQSLPNQDRTLFYDLETGMFGDSTGVEVDPTHNVFSPCLVFPNSKGHWEYARMTGLGHKDYKSTYTFVIRFGDGYAIGIAHQEMTPAEIVADFTQTDMVNIAFLDGGGSAQAGFRDDNNTMNYVHDTERPTASAVVISRKYTSAQTAPVEVPQEEPVQEEPEAEEPEDIVITEEDEEPSMKEEITVRGQLAKLIDAKTIYSCVVIGTLCYMEVNQIPTDEKFLVIVTAIITFYFSHQANKGAK